uniref:Transmembrane and coiled-coil domain-containing protein 5B n=1 Tax=Zea mays TaxID=4577 RepID=A0A804Q5P5_MAIZE
MAASCGTPSPAKRPRHSDVASSGGDSDSDSDGDLVSDLREIVCLLRLIKGGANKDGQKICEQVIASVAADIQTMLEETQLKFEEERQNSLKCESSLNEEYSKFQETYDTFCKEKDAHMQTFRDLLSKVEVEKKKLLEKYEHHMEEETNTLSELDETISEKVTHAEHSVRRVNQDGKSFIVFRKSTGLFLDCGSDDDFDLDEWRC